jgi:disulfide bond formation protein DsbB
MKNNIRTVTNNLRSFVFSDIAIFFLAFGAMFGSLFFQYYLNLPPCALCIIQRYFMYPIAFIAAFGVVFRKKLYPVYLALSILGGAVAAYHVYIEQSGVPSSIGACTLGQSCNDIVLEIFGFITIPMLSLVSFIAIIVISLVAMRRDKRISGDTEALVEVTTEEV